MVPREPVAARGLVNGWMALAPDGMERSGRFSRYHLSYPGWRKRKERGREWSVRGAEKRWGNEKSLPEWEALWYWVGESNSYCKIENLEY